MQNKEVIARYIFQGASVLTAGCTLVVLGFMIFLALPVLKSGFFFDLFTQPWEPDQNMFGICPMVAGTLVISALSLVISFPVSLGCAVFIEFVRPGRLGRFLKKTVQLMTAVPTVIYGFVGVFLLVPFIREFFLYGNGMCILSASVMLSFVIAPTMILFFSQSFRQVPASYINAVDALGGTRFQKFVFIIIPQAWPGIVTGLILAFGRAAGDTLIALMLSGNSVMMPSSLIDSARTLTSHIAMIIAADFSSIEFKIIFICGILLYLITGCGIILAKTLERRWAV